MFSVINFLLWKENCRIASNFLFYFFMVQGLCALWLATECVGWRIIMGLNYKTKYWFLVEVFMSIQDQRWHGLRKTMELQFLVQLTMKKIHLHFLLMRNYLKHKFFIVQLLLWVITRYTDQMLLSCAFFWNILC